MGFSRHRKRSSICCAPITRTQTSFRLGGVVVGPWVAGQAGAIMETEDMLDVVTPGYQSLVNRGIIINTSMTHTRTAAVSEDCTFQDVFYTGPYAAYSNTEVHEGVNVPRQMPWMCPSVDVQLHNDSGGAINRAYADVNNGTAQLLVDIGELSQTYSMLKNPFQETLNLLKKTRKSLSPREILKMKTKGVKVWGKTHEYLDAAPSTYLEWRYGWRPALRSIDDVCHAIAENLNQHPKRFTGRGKAESSNTGSQTRVTYYNPIGGTWQGVQNSFSTEVTRKVSYRAGVLAEGFLSSARNVGVSFADIPSAAWELVPYSFVADWVIGVGDWLAAHRPTPGFKYLASWLTAESEDVYKHVVTYHSGSGTSGTGSTAKAYSRSEGKSSLQRTSWTKRRFADVRPTVLPQPDLEFRSLTHLVDSLALMYQRWR